MLDVRYSHLYFYQSLNRLQRGLSAIAELLVLSVISIREIFSFIVAVFCKNYCPVSSFVNQNDLCSAWFCSHSVRWSENKTTVNVIETGDRQDNMHVLFSEVPRVGPGHPYSPLVHLLLHLFPFHFSLSFIGFTYFLLLSILSLSTRIVPLSFQAGGRRRRPNLGLVCVLLCNFVTCIP